MRIEQCQTCRFFDSTITSENRGRCVRFPAIELTERNRWCGEWSVDPVMTCGAIRPLTEAEERWSKGPTHFRYAIPAPPTRRCLREKGHEGKHADREVEWEQTP